MIKYESCSASVARREFAAALVRPRERDNPASTMDRQRKPETERGLHATGLREAASRDTCSQRR
jgi:hypothetical protein